MLIDDAYVANPRVIPSIATSNVRNVFDVFRDFHREAEEQKRAMLSEDGPSAGPSAADAVVAASAAFGKSSRASKKLKTLEELFRPPVDLLYPGSFHGAKEEGNGANLWLLINIQNHKEFACQCLNRDIWSHGAVREIVKQHFVFWQVYHDSAEGLKYKQFYPIEEYPYIAILDPRTGERMLTLKQFDPVSFCEALTEFLRMNPSPHGTSNAPPYIERFGGDKDANGETVNGTTNGNGLTAVNSSNSLIDETEDCQLQAAIRASLEESSRSNDSKAVENASSTARPRTEKESTESEDEADEERDDTDEELETFSCSEDENDAATESGRNSRDDPVVFAAVENSNSDTNDSRDAASRRNLSSYQRNDDVGTDAGKDEASTNDPLDVGSSSGSNEDWRRHLGTDETAKTKINFRLPEGDRDQLELPADSALLALVLFVKSKGFSSERFELVTNFPRKKLSYMDAEMTLKAAGLYPQETVFVQEREIPLAN